MLGEKMSELLKPFRIMKTLGFPHGFPRFIVLDIENHGFPQGFPRLLPTRECYGQALLHAERFAEAEDVFRQSLYS